MTTHYASIIVCGCPQISVVLTTSDGLYITVKTVLTETGVSHYKSNPADAYKQWDGRYLHYRLPAELVKLGKQKLLEGSYGKGPHSSKIDSFFIRLFLGRETLEKIDWTKVRRRIEDRIRKEFVPEFLVNIASQVGGVKFSE